MNNNLKTGLSYGLCAYIMWGLLPIYWKQLNQVPSMEVLANRFIWSVVFVFMLLALTRRLGIFLSETKAIFSSRSTTLRILSASALITVNWGLFIWAVETGHILDTSMGYYINPLVNVVFGMFFLGERLNKLQLTAVILAAIGISIMVVKNGSLPLTSLGLAVTFALYGLMKKKIVAQPLTSVMLETLIVSPGALLYLYYLANHGGNAYQAGDGLTLLYLAGSGVATATPIILFTACARMLPLYMIGFMQYLAPTISFFLGVIMYKEAFTSAHAWSFGFIWCGLAFFIWSTIRQIRGLES